MAFVHLHNHSDFSILDGATRIPDMVKRAVDLKMPAVALTDHGYMFGIPNLDLECRKYNDDAANMKQWRHHVECFQKGWELEEPAPDAPPLVETLPDEAAPPPDAALLAADDRARLLAAVRTLPGPRRDVFLLRAAGVPFAEIATRFSIPLNTALGRMHDAMQALRAALAATEDPRP